MAILALIPIDPDLQEGLHRFRKDSKLDALIV